MKHFCLNCGTELDENCLVCPKCFRCSYLDMLDDKVVNSEIGFLTDRQLELNTQWMKYRCGPKGSAGHGYAAEDGNALNDILNGHNVEFSGRNNSESGPDRIVDGIKIQTKYCASAKYTVSEAFDKKTGLYKYEGQILEVPKDQYLDALREMEIKIKEGKVPGYSDPADANKIIKRGDYTYRQAVNLTKAGNIDSLIFDAKTHSIIALSAFGISFSIKLCLMAVSCRNMEELKDSVKLSFLSGLQTGTITLSSGIMASQLLKTTFGRNFAAATQKVVNNTLNDVYQTDIGKKIIHNLAKNILGKDIYGAAAKNAAKKYASNFFRTNIVTNLSVLVVSSLPDTYFLLSGQISKPQFVKNLVVNTSCVFAGTIGAYIGVALGGSVGGVLGGLIGGLGGNVLSKKIADKIHKDDAEQMYHLINVAFVLLSNDYLIQTEDEFNTAIKCIIADKAIDTNLLRAMYSIGKENGNDWIRVELAYRKLEYYFYLVVRGRKKVKLLDNYKVVLGCIDELGDDIKNNNTDNKEDESSNDDKSD